MSVDEMAMIARTQEVTAYNERTAYSLTEVANRWGMERMSVYRAIRRGDIPAFRLGKNGDYLILKRVVEEIERTGERAGS